MHTLVLKRDSSKEGFPDLFLPQKMGRAVGVKDCNAVGELEPQRDKLQIHGVFEQVTFMLVQIHPGNFFDVVNGKVRGSVCACCFCKNK